MKKLLISTGAAALLALAALAPTAASAGGPNGGHGHGHGPKHTWNHKHFHGYGWGFKGGYIHAGYACPRVPVTILTAYGPVVKFVRSCGVYY